MLIIYNVKYYLDSRGSDLDVLPALKEGDSYSWRRTSATENVFCRIEITIMQSTAITASPLPYSKVCDTFRPRIGQAAAIRTDLGGESFAHFRKLHAMLNSLVRQLRSEGRPADVVHRLGHAGFAECRRIPIANHDVVVVCNELARLFMQKMVTSIGDFCVDRLHTPAFARPLPVQHSVERFDTIAEYQIHISSTVQAKAGSNAKKIVPTALQSVPFTPRPEGRGFSGQF